MRRIITLSFCGIPLTQEKITAHDTSDPFYFQRQIRNHWRTKVTVPPLMYHFLLTGHIHQVIQHPLLLLHCTTVCCSEIVGLCCPNFQCLECCTRTAVANKYQNGRVLKEGGGGGLSQQKWGRRHTILHQAGPPRLTASRGIQTRVECVDSFIPAMLHLFTRMEWINSGSIPAMCFGKVQRHGRLQSFSFAGKICFLLFLHGCSAFAAGKRTILFSFPHKTLFFRKYLGQSYFSTLSSD